MTRQHLPFRYVNGRQRCSRCGAILATDPAETSFPRTIWLQDGEELSLGRALPEESQIPAEYPACEDMDWFEERVHEADGAGHCARCGEELWLLGDEPAGMPIIFRVEKREPGWVSFSGSLPVLASGPPPDIPLCSPRL